jgi:histidinol phosphatase-like enzyme
VRRGRVPPVLQEGTRDLLGVVLILLANQSGAERPSCSLAAADWLTIVVSKVFSSFGINSRTYKCPITGNANFAALPPSAPPRPRHAIAGPSGAAPVPKTR